MSPSPRPTPTLTCPLCGATSDASARCCAQCGGALGEARAELDGQGQAPLVPFACESCGVSLLAPRAQRPLRCPFCDADHVQEGELARGAPAPELILPFRVDRAQALDVLRGWLGFTPLRPAHVVRRALRDGATPVYVPCWMFSALAHSTWRATIGERWTRTVTAPPPPGAPASGPTHHLAPAAPAPGGPQRPTAVLPALQRDTRATAPVRPATGVSAQDGSRAPAPPPQPPPQAPVEVEEVEWYPLEGRHHAFHAQEIVGAVEALDQSELLAVLPLDTRGARRFRPAWLEGRPVVQADVQSEAALPTAEERFAERERGAVREFLPGDEARDLQVTTTLHRVQGALVLAPLWVASWTHRGRVWRVIINGQSGTCTGTPPLSLLRIGAVAAALVALLAVAVTLGGSP